MKYFQSWQDFMRDPANKALKESKGIHACKQKYIQEQNKMQWHDPVMLTENGAGISLSDTTAAGASGGSVSDFITGFSKEECKFTFASGIVPDWTGSDAIGIGVAANQPFWDVQAYNGTVDFSAGHTDSMKKIRFYVHSGSGTDFAPTVASDIDIVITASCHTVDGKVAVIGANGAGGYAIADGNITSSILGQWNWAIHNQAATAVVAGFTNTIAPSSIISSSLISVAGAAANNVESTSSIVVTGVYKASVDTAVTTGYASNSNTTGSITSTNVALDTFHAEQGGQLFDGGNLPYANMPRKDSNAS